MTQANEIKTSYLFAVNIAARKSLLSSQRMNDQKKMFQYQINKTIGDGMFFKQSIARIESVCVR